MLLHRRGLLLRELLLPLTILFLLGFAAVSTTEDYITLSPQPGQDNHIQINSAIKAVSEKGGGTVFLTAGVYDISGPITIRSNVRLTGDPEAIIRVWAQNQWFTGQVGVISNPGEVVSNVEIDSFQIDGNIKNLPRNFDSSPGHDRDCEKLLLFGGWSSNFATNIKIHNLKLYNSFSDGIYIRFADGVSIYDNTISNCQHEGFYLSCVKNAMVYRNNIAGITSDCGRLDNCVNTKVFDNIFFSYSGETWGAYSHGENGLQIGDTGSSHGYTSGPKPMSTENIEVYGNTFSDPGLRAIWYHEGVNVYIHDNKFVDADTLETMGVSIGDISMTNPPSIELSEHVFSNIHKILNFKFYDSGFTGQAAESIPYEIRGEDKGLLRGGISVIGFKNSITIDNKTYVPDNESYIIKSNVIVSPLYSVYNLGATKINQNLKTEFKDGKVYASLDVELIGSSTSVKKGKARTTLRTLQKSTFVADPVPSPEVLQLPDEIPIKVDEFKGANNYTTVALPGRIEGIQRIEVVYNETRVNRSYLIGERNETGNGVIYTNFSTLDMWTGSLSHTGNKAMLYGPFDIEKLQVKAYSVYGEVPVTITQEEHIFTGQKAESNYIVICSKILITCLFGYFLFRLIL